MKVVSVLCLFIVALTYAAAQQKFPPAPADGSCTPGQTYQLDCNTCICSPKGQLAACTQAACLSKEKRESSIDDLPELPAGRCEPGKSYRQDCNTCVCGKDGEPGCTYKLCQSPNTGTIRNRRNAEPQECSPGDTKKDDCNTCNCANGHWACTEKACLKKRDTPLPPIPADGTCVPGESYLDDCNVCRCLGKLGGKFACTDKACPKRDRRSADPQRCSPGQVTQQDCNTCRCINGGWACTRRACLKKRATQECSVGDTKTENCNDCKCTLLGDGSSGWVCTRRACPENLPSRTRRDAQECKVGDTKQEDCNSCRCLQLGDAKEDKTGWACTKIACVSPPPQARKRRAVQKCTVGDTKQDDCNTCNCIQLGDGSNDWACTKKTCPSLKRRDVSGTTDLKNTPCAPNDYFQLDCNTCYCNSAKTGYLCTENICAPGNTTSTETNSTSASTESATASSSVILTSPIPLTTTTNAPPPICNTQRIPSTSSISISSNSNSSEDQRSSIEHSIEDTVG